MNLEVILFFMDWIDDFLTYISTEKRFSQHTITAYQTDLNQFDLFVKNEMGFSSIKEVNFQAIRSWIFFLLENENTARSVNRKISTLKTFYKFLMKNSYIQSNPMSKIISPKQSQRLPSFVDEGRMNNLFSVIEFPDTFEGIRDKTILETFYALGIRLSELINITLQSIDFHNQTIRIIGKRNKERIIPFGPHLKKCLEQYLKMYEKTFGMLQQNSPIFVTNKGSKAYPMLINRIVNKYIAMVSSIEQKSPHVIRHTFATHLLNQGADLNAIKELLGHANLAATQVYTHTSIEKLKKIYKNAHPRA